MYLVLLLLPLALADCPVSMVLTKSDTCKLQKLDGHLYDIVFVTPHPAWTSMEGAHWVWSDNNESVGTQTFVGLFSLAEWKRPYLTSLTLSIAVDNSAKILLNGVQLNTDGAGGFDRYLTYELKDKYIGTSAQSSFVNMLAVEAYNADGPGGVIFKIEATYN